MNDINFEFKFFFRWRTEGFDFNNEDSHINEGPGSTSNSRNADS